MQEDNRKESDLMSIDGFTICIKLDIQKELGSGYTLEVKDITKNNDTRLKGLTIMGKDSNVHPTIYMESFYDRYMEGESLAEIKESILQTFQKNRNSGKQFDVTFFTDWQEVKEKVTYKLVNYDKNREFLKDVPHKKILDFAIVYECIMEVRDFGSASVLIRNEHMKLWGTAENELHSAAFKNTPKLMGYSLSNMAEVIAEMMGCAVGDYLPMYVLTNRYKFHGAGCILYKNLLNEIAEKWGCDICIIPSSIHEVILMPVYMAGSYAEMSQIVREVNQTQLLPEEILSDKVYLFTRETGDIMMQEEMEYE